MGIYVNILFALLFHHLLTGSSQAQQICYCTDPRYESSWGAWTTYGVCTGACETATRRSFRTCIASINRVLLAPQQCPVISRCTNHHTCGSWSVWSSIGPCTSRCQQVQARYCYEQILGGNRRTDACIGAQGATEQNRTVPCVGRNCFPGATITTTTTTRPTTTTTTTTTIEPTTTTVQPVVVTSTTATRRTRTSTLPSTVASDVDNVATVANRTRRPPADRGNIPQSFFVETTQPPPPPPHSTPTQAFSTVTLAAILGSVALICVTIVAVAIAIILNRRKRPRTDYPNYSNGTTVTMMSHMGRGDNYEEVGPPLPDRPPPRDSTFLEEPQTVTNALYQPMSEKGDETRFTPSTSDAPYLQPLTPTGPIEPEPVYFSIDDTRR